MHSLFKYTEPAIEDLTEKLTCFAQEQLNKAKLMHNITGGKKKRNTRDEQVSNFLCVSKT